MPLVYAEKRELKHYYICKLFVEGAIVLFAVSTLWLIVNAVYMGIRPQAEIRLEDTGFAYRTELLIGYIQCGYSHLPQNAEIISSKAFCVGFMLLGIITRNLPFLFIFNEIRQILRTIQNSHSPFVPAIVRNTKRVGIALILLGVLGELVLQGGMSLAAYHVLSVTNPFEFAWIFSGIIVLLVSDIFDRGCELQQFSDETL